MGRTLSDEDIEAVALRVVAIMSERLAAPRPPVTAILEPIVSMATPATLRLSYTRKELSAELNLSAETLSKLENQGRLRPLPGIRHKIYSRVEVERFLSSGETKWRPSK